MQNRFELLNGIVQTSHYNLCHNSLRTIKKSLSSFTQGLAEEFKWTRKFSVLSIFINSSKGYFVSIKLNQKKSSLKFSCSCDSDAICYHIIVAIIAIKYFITKEYKHENYNPYSDEDHKKHLNDLLYGNCFNDVTMFASLPREISICLFPKFFIRSYSDVAMSCFLIRGGRIMTPEEYQSISELVGFHSMAYGYDSEAIFIKKISSVAKKYPLYVYDNDDFHPVRWDEFFLVQAVAEINIADNDTVCIRRMGRFYGVLLDGLMQLGGKLVLDKKTGTLGRIISQESVPWYSVHKWKDAAESDFVIDSYKNFPAVSTVFEISILLFNECYISWHQGENNFSDIFIFKNNNQAVVLEEATSQARMVIRHSAGMKLSLLLGEVYFSHIHVPDLNEEGINQIKYDGNTLANRFSAKDAIAWLKGYCAASCAKNEDELESIITEVSKAIIVREGIDEEQHIRDPFIKLYSTMQKEQKLVCLLIENNKPYAALVDNKVYWLFEAILFIIFGKNRTLSDLNGSYIETNKVLSSLYELKKILQDHDLDLYIDSKEVKFAAFDITVDAAKSETDWFELHPEVHYNGQKISAREWKSIVEGNGIWTRNDEILAVDTQSCTALAILSRWINNEQSQLSAKSVMVVPRLKIFDLIELRKNGVMVSISEHDEKLLHSLSNFTAIPVIALPEKLRCTLREYQKEGYYWLAFLYQHRFGACLADDMGLGKTVQAIALLGAIREKIISSAGSDCKQHLIVVPTSLVFNWINEIQTFYPDFRVREYCSTRNDISFDSADIFIVTYEVVRRDIEKLCTIAFNVIIFDEAQGIKNILAKRTSAARLLRGNFKVCITGTPLENHAGEYYSIMDLAIPGLLPAYTEFKRSGLNGINSMVSQTRPFILRRTKEVISQELPEKIESDVYFYMTEKQRSLYTRITQEVRNQVVTAYKDKTKGQASIIALTALLRLRQICISPELVIPLKKSEPAPKIEYIAEQIPSLIERGHAMLIFSQFTNCLDIIEHELKSAHITYARIDGTVPMVKRKKIIESFQNDKTVNVLLMSLKTGGVGLNLTRASYVFHVDPWWNAAVENQASDRAYRIGQKNTVMVIRLIMHHSIEEKMLVLKKSKEELFKMIVEGAAEKTGSAISQNDFDFLLS